MGLFYIFLPTRNYSLSIDGRTVIVCGRAISEAQQPALRPRGQKTDWENVSGFTKLVAADLLFLQGNRFQT